MKREERGRERDYQTLVWFSPFFALSMTKNKMETMEKFEFPNSGTEELDYLGTY